MALSETETLRTRAAQEVARAYRARDAAMDRLRAAEAARDALAAAAEACASLLWAMPDGTPHRRDALDALLAVLPDDTDPDDTDPDGEDPPAPPPTPEEGPRA